MELLFKVVVWLTVLTLILAIISLFISWQNRLRLKKKIKNIEKEKNKLLAIDELKKIIRKDPHNFEAREKLADLLSEKKSYLPAIKEYLTILDYTGFSSKIDEVKILTKIGEAYIKLQNYDEARKYFLMVKTKDDLNFSANINLAQIEMQNKNYEKAETYFNIIENLYPDDIEIKKPFGICCYFQNKFLPAIDKLEKYLKVKQDDYEAIYYLAYSYYNQSRFDEAIKYFEKLKTNTQYSFDAFYMMGLIHFEQSLFNQAVEDFNNALLVGKDLDISKKVEINYYLGESYFKIHDITNALTYWKKVADVVPNYKDVLSKIENYSQVVSNTLLEMYLVGSVSQFIKICQLFAKYYLKHYSLFKEGNINFLESQMKEQGTLEMLVELTSGNFIETYFFVFIRSTGLVGDMILRDMYNTLKDKRADKGICVTAGGFTDAAKDFVESRMLKIVERDKLTEILNKISVSLKSKNQ